jgi:hypothetical protein
MMLYVILAIIFAIVIAVVIGVSVKYFKPNQSVSIPAIPEPVPNPITINNETIAPSDVMSPTNAPVSNSTSTTTVTEEVVTLPSAPPDEVTQYPV